MYDISLGVASIVYVGATLLFRIDRIQQDLMAAGQASYMGVFQLLGNVRH